MASFKFTHADVVLVKRHHSHEMMSSLRHFIRLKIKHIGSTSVSWAPEFKFAEKLNNVQRSYI